MPTASKPPERRRGRPVGARTRVLREQNSLGRHHFAFLRAWLQGLDSKAAWQRYVAFAEDRSDLRTIDQRRREWFEQVLLDAEVLQRLPASEQPAGMSAEKTRAAMQLLAQARPLVQAPSLPSLDEFAMQQGFDPDQFSQAELVGEYQAFYGLDQPTDGAQTAAADRRRAAQLQALRLLEHGLAREPQPSDPVARWFSPATHPRLQACGVRSLGDLQALIAQRGDGWYRQVRGLGRVRAAAVVAWMVSVASSWAHPLQEARLQPPQRARALRRASPQDSNNAAPADFAGPPAGSPGAADLAAAHQWLLAHKGRPATLRAYAKEAERFCLWCLRVLGKHLAALDSADCLAYGTFLAQVPTAWIQPVALPRSDPSWRPFRGQLQASSQRLALVAVQVLLDGLHKTGYLAANPMVRARAHVQTATLEEGRGPAQTPAPGRPGGARGFSAPEWAFLLDLIAHDEAAALQRPQTPHGLPGGARQRRLRLVLCLLGGTGLSLPELAAASRCDLLEEWPANGHGSTAAAWLSVHGRKPRQVALPQAALAMINAHHEDAAAVGALPSPPPIVCTLRPLVGRWLPSDSAPGAQPEAVLHQGHMAPDRRLGENGLYRMLQRFFVRAGAGASGVDGLSADHLSADHPTASSSATAASTRWLRHSTAGLA